MVLGTNDTHNSENEKVKLFPNPAQTWFMIGNEKIRSDRQAQLIIYNMYGAVVKRQLGLSKRIETGHLTTGMYIVRIYSQGKVYNEKLLINR